MASPVVAADLVRSAHGGPGGIFPVHLEPQLEGVHGPTGDADRGVPPEPERTLPEVFVADVEPAAVGHLAVYHGYLPVVAVVLLRAEQKPQDPVEESELPPGLLEPLYGLPGAFPETEPVREEPDLDAFLDLLGEDVDELVPQLVVPYYVILEVDVLLGLPQVLIEVLELVLPESVQPHVVVVGIAHGADLLHSDSHGPVLRVPLSRGVALFFA